MILHFRATQEKIRLNQELGRLWCFGSIWKEKLQEAIGMLLEDGKRERVESDL